MDIHPHSDFDARRGTGPRPTVTHRYARFATAPTEVVMRARVPAHVSSVGITSYAQLLGWIEAGEFAVDVRQIPYRKCKTSS